MFNDNLPHYLTRFSRGVCIVNDEEPTTSDLFKKITDKIKNTVLSKSESEPILSDLAQGIALAMDKALEATTDMLKEKLSTLAKEIEERVESLSTEAMLATEAAEKKGEAERIHEQISEIGTLHKQVKGILKYDQDPTLVEVQETLDEAKKLLESLK